MSASHRSIPRFASQPSPRLHQRPAFARTARLGVAAIIAATLAACSDLSTEPPRRPTSLSLDSSVVTVTQGAALTPRVRVLDQDGDPIEIPSWAEPVWASSDQDVMRVADGVLTTRAPGEAKATVSVAGLTATERVRVNPSEITVRLDSVSLVQEGRGGVLMAGEDAALRVFLFADRPNFFSPPVRVTIRRDTTIVATLDATPPGESIPRAARDSAWRVTIPGVLVQPGNSFEVSADPQRTLPLTAESLSRYPTAGTARMPFELTLRIEDAYLIQSVQRLDGSVPLVAGRDALLRVFLVAGQENAVSPEVRATLLDGGTVVRTIDLEREIPSVPTIVDESALSSSWNARIPASLVAPGLSIGLTVDAAGLTLDTLSRTDTTIALDVRPVPPLRVRFIPIYLSRYGTTGDLDVDNEASFLAPTAAIHPIGEVDADLRSTYVSAANPATETGWNQLLSELDALRTADGDDRYYYGVIRDPPESEIAGIGELGWPVALGYDDPDGGPLTMAHELGHNFGRFHAPCGNPAGVDFNYPYAGGSTGVWGYDTDSGELRDPAVYKDLMTYCSPEWISDYTYEGVFEFRVLYDWAMTSAERAAREPALLVWGRVENERPVLEPAFDLDMPAALPDGDGPYRIIGYDAAGAVLFDYSFTPRRIDQPSDPSAASFAYAIPARIAHPDRLRRLVLDGPTGTAEQTRSGAPTPAITAERGPAGQLSVSWAADTHPVALIRDAATGDVISFARGGRIEVPGQRRLDVLVSDGVGTISATAGPQP